jgi:hypothetical protein
VKQLSNGDNPVEKVREAVGGDVKDAVSKKIDEAGGLSGMAKGMLPGLGGDKSDKSGESDGGEDLGKYRVLRG